MKVLVSGRLPLQATLAPLSDDEIDVVQASDGEDIVCQAALHQPTVIILDDASIGYAQRLSGSSSVVILRREEPEDTVIRAALAIASALGQPTASNPGESASG